MHLQYFGTCKLDDRIWFCNGGFNGLFSLSMENYSLKFEHSIPYVDDFSFVPYIYGCAIDADRLCFIPNAHNRILLYDTKKKEIQSILMVLPNHANAYVASGLLQYNGQVWLFPQKLENGIFTFNIDTLKLERNLEISEVLDDIKVIEAMQVLSETRIAVLSDNKILEVDIEKKKIVYQKSFEKNAEIYSFKYDGSSYWILQKSITDVLEWDKERDTLIRYSLGKAEWITTEAVPYADVVFHMGQIILLGHRLKYVMTVDKDTHTISKAFDYPLGFQFIHSVFYTLEWMAFYSVDITGNKIIFHPGLGNMVLIYDVVNKSVEGRELMVTSRELPFLQDYSYIRQRTKAMDGFVNESECEKLLEAFIMNIKNESGLKGSMWDENGIGRNIHDLVMMN